MRSRRDEVGASRCGGGVRGRSELSPGEWAVLALVAEGPTHGWAVARALSPDGEIGAAWTFPRPLVYRALDTLLAAGLIEEKGVEDGARGPRRTIVGCTRAGRDRVRRWLTEPVGHVRDARSLLLLKLVFTRRAGRDARPLLVAQQAALIAIEAALAARLAAAGGETERLLAAFRLETTRAVVRFVDGLLAGGGR